MQITKHLIETASLNLSQQKKECFVALDLHHNFEQNFEKSEGCGKSLIHKFNLNKSLENLDYINDICFFAHTT